MQSSVSKEDLRAGLLLPVDHQVLAVQGAVAERVRRIDGYKQAQQVFVDPSLLLRQTRINVLLDGKELIMPAAGLKDGFYLLKPLGIPHKNLLYGVTYKGLKEYGCRLSAEEIGSLEISLMIGESLLTDNQGWRIGRGDGFFDLAAAILQDMGGLKVGCRLVSALPAADNLLEAIPHDPWDVRCDVVVYPEGSIETVGPDRAPGIKWEVLSRERIKKITPLWKLNEVRK